MPTKKKPRLSFDIPEDVGSGRDSGWVYRSDAEDVTHNEPDTNGNAASSLSLALTAMVQMVTLGMAVATIPLTIGMRILGIFAAKNK
jgi:hypothetical protein